MITNLLKVILMIIHNMSLIHKNFLGEYFATISNNSFSITTPNFNILILLNIVFNIIISSSSNIVKCFLRFGQNRALSNFDDSLILSTFNSLKFFPLFFKNFMKTSDLDCPSGILKIRKYGKVACCPIHPNYLIQLYYPIHSSNPSKFIQLIIIKFIYQTIIFF